MKALVVEKPKSYGIVEKDAPIINGREVLIKVKNCCICASDFEVLYGMNEEEIVYPIIPGHEWSGDVVQAGKGCEKFLGKRVTGNNAVPCNECPSCEAGKFHICKRKEEIGFNLNGAYAEYMVLPGKNVIELPDNVDYKTAALTEPLSVCLHALRLTGMRKENKTLIIGDGVIGIFIILLAKHFGFNNLIIAGHHQNRLEFANKITGAAIINTKNTGLRSAVKKTFKQEAELIFEASGNSEAVSESISILEYGGTLCLVGSYHGPQIQINPNDITLYEQSIIGSVSYYQAEMENIVKLLGEGLLDGADVITHVFTLENFSEAFDTAEKRRDNVIRACFEF